MDLNGKIALITGAGGKRGIGRATALQFACCGADVALTDVHREPEDLPSDEVESGWRGIESVAEEVEKEGRRALTITCDMTRREQVPAMIDQVAEHFGRIDILVNNARAVVGRDKMPVTELPEEVWDHVMTINATAVFQCTKYTARHMIAQGQGGRIVNIGSDCSKVGRAETGAYCASKFALHGLTQSTALDLAPYDITVNAVCPGFVNTNRLSYWERAEAEKRGVPHLEYRAELVKQLAGTLPLRRLAEPEDVAYLVAFLASKQGAYITGQAYNVNGGQLFH